MLWSGLISWIVTSFRVNLIVPFPLDIFVMDYELFTVLRVVSKTTLQRIINSTSAKTVIQIMAIV